MDATADSLAPDSRHRFDLQAQTETQARWSCPECSRTVSFDRLSRRFRIVYAGDAAANHGGVAVPSGVQLSMGGVQLPPQPSAVH